MGDVQARVPSTSSSWQGLGLPNEHPPEPEPLDGVFFFDYGWALFGNRAFCDWDFYNERVRVDWDVYYERGRKPK